MNKLEKKSSVMNKLEIVSFGGVFIERNGYHKFY